MTGTSRVCITATTIPAKASSGTTAVLVSRGAGAAGSVVVRLMVSGNLSAEATIPLLRRSNDFLAGS
ncbi:hypothetical protein GCM10009535_51800 [Streptomyces thermocarboxydovorans]|uniref:Uncharacterized protein n=1 Tax=Streptomyces thermocarboxydovorans TaxID=59298 RepID=A0ABN1HSK4_9ACTN